MLENKIEQYLSFLKKHDAGKFEHSNENLLKHIIGTIKFLEK